MRQVVYPLAGLDRAIHVILLPAYRSSPQMNSDRLTVAARLRSFRFASAGIAFMLKTQHNAWLHVVATFIVLGVGFALRVSVADWRWLIVGAFGGWGAGAMNTWFGHLCRVGPADLPASSRPANEV